MVIYEILHNQVLLTGIAGWCTAQVVKFFIHAMLTHQWDITRIWGDGGMPSAHSATVTSVCIAVGFESGFASSLFALAAIFAIVVMHDAMGVRLETGKQAALLNDIMSWFADNGKELTYEERLKEFVGHTPIQVYAGALTGFLVAVLIHQTF